jgi:hypothetical protein
VALMLAQDRDGGVVEGDGALPGSGLPFVQVRSAVVVGDGVVDRQRAFGQVEVGPAQCAQLTAAWAA